MFSATDLKVDNSSLTGESEPQERGPVLEGSKVRPVEAENLVGFHCILWLRAASYCFCRCSIRLLLLVVKVMEVRQYCPTHSRCEADIDKQLSFARAIILLLVCQFPRLCNLDTNHLIGQIASLTGGESGNRSPLAVEMYVKSSPLFLIPNSQILSLVIISSKCKPFPNHSPTHTHPPLASPSSPSSPLSSSSWSVSPLPTKATQPPPSHSLSPSSSPGSPKVSPPQSPSSSPSPPNAWQHPTSSSKTSKASKPSAHSPSSQQTKQVL